jgi:hypothetical protein
VNKGKIIDATIIEAPVQRNSRDGNKDIKEGDIPQEWSDKKQSTKTQKPAGQRKTMMIILGIKITSGWTAKRSSLTTIA